MNETTEISAIDQFLANWRKEAFEHYMEQSQAFEAELAEIFHIPENRTYEQRCYYNHRSKHAARRQMRKELEQRYGKLVAENLHSTPAYKRPERLNAILDREVASKRESLISRVEREVGEIVDAKGLVIASDGNINGYVEGTEGRCSVETITAGSHNVQRLHYRVLVKKIT